MGVHSSAAIVFGVKVVPSNKIIQWTESKYNEDTGEPYQKEMSKIEYGYVVEDTEIEVTHYPDEEDNTYDDQYDEDFYYNNTIVTGYDSIEFIGFICATVDNGQSIALGTPDYPELIRQLREAITPFFESDDVELIILKSQLHLLHHIY